MNLLLIQNHGVEDGDDVLAYVRERAIPHTVACSFRADPLPRARGFDALVVFGSPASCMNLARLPLLARVGELTGEFLAEGKAVLGICFGAQLLAQVLGAEVRRNDAPEVGCLDVRLTTAGRASLYFAGFAEVFPNAQWHKDTFALPEGATLLASSTLCRHQAFVHGRSVGLQFHLEASQRKVEAWMRKYTNEIPPGGRSAEQMLADFARTAEERSRLCVRFMDNFLGVLAGADAPR